MSAVITALAVSLLLSFLFLSRSYSKAKSRANALASSHNGYILWNQVTHSRLLPVESSHAFTYSTVALFVSLNSLERGALDLGHGWIFGYGGIHGRLVGLRPDPYLVQSTSSRTGGIRGKLVGLLKERGFHGELVDGWMLTMPSYLGYEGINPLTVYFCYKAGHEELWLVVLEVHNTFGESHVYVLEVGMNEDSIQGTTSFDHRWTFPRAFHVSPFNDRAGYYTVSIRRPSSPPDAKAVSTPPLPIVSVHLHTPSSSGPGPLKLTALFRATHSMPLTTPHLIRTLVNYPLALFLSLPRILYHAWILHYKKRLDVYIRPEPLSAHVDNTRMESGGVRWQSAGPLEKWCRRLVYRFIERRARELGVRVAVSAGDPSASEVVFGPARERSTLKIRYLSPRFYTILVVAPCPELAYLLGARTEGIFELEEGDVELFLKLFASESDGGSMKGCTFGQRLRCWVLPERLRTATRNEIPRQHFIDSDWPWSTCIVGLVLFLGLLERWIFGLVHARVVSGDAPWEEWERAEEVFLSEDTFSKRKVVGSSERGGEVGSVLRRSRP